jgi:hypothetical protein
MSFVVTIKRAPEKPPLAAQEFQRLVQEDGSLSGVGENSIIWTDSANGTKRYINLNPEKGELETDDTRGDEEGICRFLDKLRSIASILDARVFGEGQDITDPTQVPGRRAGCASVILCVLAFVALLAILLQRTFCADEPPDGPKKIFKDEFTENLTGDWKLTRRIRGKEVQNAVIVEWVLNHQSCRFT